MKSSPSREPSVIHQSPTPDGLKKWIWTMASSPRASYAYRGGRRASRSLHRRRRFGGCSNGKAASQKRRQFRELAGFFVALGLREPVVICTYVTHMI
jgi:hypothetical protein